MGNAQSIENRNYELHSLGWKSFQDLCHTILKDIFGQNLQAFAATSDGGRDGYYTGVWNKHDSCYFQGPSTIQCKFSKDKNKSLALSLLNEELDKAKELALKGLCSNYILITNLSVKGKPNEEKIRKAFLEIPGIENIEIWGLEWLTLQINESPRLRMLVPRVYGLGDLSYIIDERAKEQAMHVLSSMKDDLSKFVITKSYKDSAEALSQKGLLILLGAAASGKSSIAATLTLVGLDQWGAPPFLIKDANQFEKHWNPNDPSQIFWVDDAFGATSYQKEKAESWNHVLKLARAAVKNGSKIIMTSRDYIFKQAIKDLKTSEFPLITDSQVQILLKDISLEEKQQILYNHIKYGDQSRSYKLALRPFLESIADNPKFLPEIARRFGTQVFTKNLELKTDSVLSFIQEPKNFLVDILNQLDEDSKAAIALIFMMNGKLPSPIVINNEEKDAIIKMGATDKAIIQSMTSLEGSFTKRLYIDELTFWTYKHPTISDAFSEIVKQDPELLEIYLKGTKAENLLEEISCGVKIRGVEIQVPQNLYRIVIDRLSEINISSDIWSSNYKLLGFLSERCSQKFLMQYLCEADWFLDWMKKHTHLSSSYKKLTLKLNEYGLLPDELRETIKKIVIESAKESLDPDLFDLKSIFDVDEFDNLIPEIQEIMVTKAPEVIKEHYYNYDPSDIPEDHYYYIERFLDELEEEYEEDIYGNFHKSKDLIDNLRSDIGSNVDSLIDQYNEENKEEPEEDEESVIPMTHGSDAKTVSSKILNNLPRSLFFDVAD